MNLLFSMSLAGSSVFLIYLAIKPAARRYLPATWRYGLLKIALLFYLLPYQYLKYLYGALRRRLFPEQLPYEETGNSYIAAYARQIVLIESGGRIQLESHTLITSILGIWAAFIVIYLVYHVTKYVGCMKDLQQIAKVPVILRDSANRQPRHKARVKVSLFESRHIATPFTIGIFTPYILLPSSLVSRRECPMIITHELTHVENRDNLIKLFCFLGMLLHCYNPLIYILYREICKVSEQVCDAAVIQNLSEQEIEQYKLLIIELSQKASRIDTLLASPFNGKFKMIKERMIVMNKTTNTSKRTRVAASLAMAALLLALSPISVWAYSPAPICECLNQQVPANDNIFYFAEEQTASQDIYDPFLEYGTEHDIFICADDQVYILDDTNHQNERLLCFHDWVSGKIYQHIEDDKGGCTVYCYDGQRCSICGSLRLISLISTTNFVKCPH